MGSTRMRIAVACGAVALLGGFGCGGGDGKTGEASPPPAVEVATPSSDAAPATPSEATTSPTTVKATPAPRTSTPTGSAPSASGPSAEEVQAVIDSMTAQLAEAAATGPETPAPTSDEIEAQLLEQLRQLGIPL